ncbi:11-S seed storage protein plant protein [Dioscorea alata]|uniref:11-S seed storage protein plant protein n=1 Tax=Dioscorea alata TaxID=55571 RepID=A0ACB7WSJ5_DIOAL|nr:11-S seed storage protein plant protein [Dioscorea alata]
MEVWDENEDQFLCAGVTVSRTIVRPRSLTALGYENSQSLTYVQQGRAVAGVTFPGCPETFFSGGRSSMSFEEETGRSEQERDRHQKLHRIQQGDIFAVPLGTVYWFYNHGDQDLILLTVFDLNSKFNQLDNSMRFFPLVGNFQRFSGKQFGREQEEKKQNQKNIISALDPQLVSESLNIDLETVRQIQSSEIRGPIFSLDHQQQQRMFWPEDKENQQKIYQSNGLDETVCYSRLQFNLDRRGEADVYSRQAGRLNSVTANKLPVLQLIGMSAEKVDLLPDAIFSPHYSVNSHTIVVVTRGDGRIQVVDDRGRNVFNGRVRQGEVIVIPQHYVSMKKAGSNGMEWVAFKTSAYPVKNQFAGRLSLFSGTPVQVLASSYGISVGQARKLKQCRKQDFVLFPPASSASGGDC